MTVMIGYGLVIVTDESFVFHCFTYDSCYDNLI